VTSMRFVADAEPDAAPVAGVFGLPLDKADIMHLAETFLFGIVAVMTLLMVLRPMVMRLTTVPGGAEALIDQSAAAGGTLALAGPAGSAGSETYSGSVSAVALLEDDSLVNVANIEGQMRASSIRRVVELIERHPEESLTIMRGWMAQEQG
jgi:flagellar M-ring protein FliF